MSFMFWSMTEISDQVKDEHTCCLKLTLAVTADTVIMKTVLSADYFRISVGMSTIFMETVKHNFFLKTM